MEVVCKRAKFSPFIVMSFDGRIRNMEAILETEII